MKFSYPSDWGNISASTAPGETGLAYFSHSTHYHLIGGGLSRDYAQGREGSKLDFGGFEQRSLSDYCGNQFIVPPAACQFYSPQIAVVVVLPAFEEFCSDFWDVSEPEYRILVDLPMNGAIHGFVWIIPILSSDYLNSLDERVGRVRSQLNTSCQAANAVVHYESELKALKAAFRNSLFPEYGDSSTTRNIRRIRDFIVSIQISGFTPR